MVSRDKYKATPLLPPGPHSADARMTGSVLANALRQSYLYSQSQGRMCGVQTYVENPWEVIAGRLFSASDYTTIARFKKHLPPHARSVSANVGFQVYGPDPKYIAYHRISISYDGDTDVGIGTAGEANTAGISIGIVSPGGQGVDPGTDGVFGVYDLPFNRADCLVELEDVTLDDANVAVITVEAYAITASVLSATASESERDSSDIVTATVPAGHGFAAGMLIWTDGFDDDIPQGSPVAVDSVTSTEIVWTKNGASDATFGGGTIYTSTGLASVYQPGIVTAWWDV